MRRYLLKRIIEIVLILYVFASTVFLIFYAMPGDVTNRYATNPNVPPEARERIKQQLGLDRPLWQQYLTYMKNLFIEHNLGVSFTEYPRPVWDIIIERLPRTVVLFLTATIISFYIGFTLGKIIAWKRGELIEYGATIVGVGLWTVFTPWWALLLIWTFAFKLDLFPISQFIEPEVWDGAKVTSNVVFGYMIATAAAASAVLSLSSLLSRKVVEDRMKRKIANGSIVVVSLGVMLWLWSSSGIGYLAADIIKHIGLPVLTLTTIAFGGTMLLMRDSMLETVKEDYIMTAKAKGLPDRVVRDRHAARTALLPVVTSFVLSIAFTLAGGIVTETIFSWPGIGLTLLNATIDQDYPLAVGTFIFMGIFVLIAHLVADILYAVLDPRISYGKER